MRYDGRKNCWNVLVKKTNIFFVQSSSPVSFFFIYFITKINIVLDNVYADLFFFFLHISEIYLSYFIKWELHTDGHTLCIIHSYAHTRVKEAVT